MKYLLTVFKDEVQETTEVFATRKRAVEEGVMILQNAFFDANKTVDNFLEETVALEERLETFREHGELQQTLDTGVVIHLIVSEIDTSEVPNLVSELTSANKSD